MSTKTSNFFSPFFIPLVFLAYGIYMQINCFDSIAHIVIFFSAITMISLITFLLYIKNSSYKAIKTSLLYLLFFLIGTLVIHLQITEFLTIRSELHGKNLTITGTIIDKEILQDNKEKLVISTNKIIDNLTNCVKNNTYIVQCHTKYPTSHIVCDIVTVHNIAIPQEKNENRSPSFNDYLAKEGIHASFFLPTTKQITRDQRPNSSLRRMIWQMRIKILQSINKKLSSKQTIALFNLLFLGQKQVLEYDILRNLFANWGINHYLARSGLHVMLLIAMWNLLLMLIPINIRYKRLLIFLISLLYAFLSWSSISFIRALSVFILASIGTFIWRQSNILHILSIVCMIMLLINPLNLFFLDFQLTFGLTFALLICNSNLKTAVFFLIS